MPSAHLGLLVLTEIALVGLLWTVGDGDDKTDGDKVLVVFTALLTGLLGLYIRSPLESGSGSNSG